jgi:hypothetical protein
VSIAVKRQQVVCTYGFQLNVFDDYELVDGCWKDCKLEVYLTFGLKLTPIPKYAACSTGDRIIETFLAENRS